MFAVKEVREGRRRLVSLALACSMVLSMFSTILPSGTAQAAEPELSPRADTSSGTAKPTLYIDFLGDDSAMFSGATPPITVPSDQDQSKFQDPVGPWELYSQDSEVGTIFWVALGIDQMSVFELAKEGRGLTGLELGFYYNTKYVEPYLGPDNGDPAELRYRTVLSDANLSATPTLNSANQWDSNYYHIAQAIPERDIVSDPDTREFPPESLPYAGTDTWKMLYVSLEKNYNFAGDRTTNRFHTVDDDKTQYVMMLPFRLKAIDHTAPVAGVDGSGPQLCFRLARDASIFSMGGGNDGAGTYDDPNSLTASFGAWEKETRTPNHNLKEMFDFEGDLNIFTGKNEKPRVYTATLSAPNASSSNGNTATLSDGMRTISVNDPSPGRDTLSDIQAGVTMTLTVNKNTGATTTTSITLTPGSSSTPVPRLTTVSTSAAQDIYTFTMPADAITVEVIYNTDYTGNTTYNAKLVLSGDDGIAANTAVLSHLDAGGDPVDRTDLSQNPVKDLLENLRQNDPMSVDVRIHPDYTAEVKVTRRSDHTIEIPAADHGIMRENNTDRWERKYTFNMPSGNVDATVTYTKRPTHYAELGVNYDGAGDPRNQATLSYRDYTNVPSGNYADGETKDIMVNGKGANKRLENVPTGRQLTLEVTVLNDYEIDEAWLYNADDLTAPRVDLKGLIAASTPISTTTDTRTYQINVNDPEGMPDHNIQVMVSFRQSNDYNLYLRLDSAGGMAANTATLSGLQKDGVTTGTVTRTGTDGTTYGSTMVYSGNTVSAAWGEASGYHVESVSVYRDRDENILISRYSTQAELNNLLTNGFTMPTSDIWVVVKFRSDNYTAQMVIVNGGGAASDTGWVTAGGLVYPLVTSAEGSTVTGKVTVNPGWYIGEHKIVGKTSGREYAFTTFSGNGYNNGAGGVVDLTFPQPGEDVEVRLEMRKGPPPEEPELSLTLKVSDPDNTDGSDNNWAQIIEVDNTALTPTRPMVRKTVGAPGQATSDTYRPLTAGQWVTIRVNPASGYRVKEPTGGVTVTPDPPFGSTVPVWDTTDPNLFRVFQPAGSITVIVEFEKIDPADPRKQTATLHITDTTGKSNTATLTNTSNALAAPANSTSTNTGTVAFQTGDSFLLSVTPDTGCKATATVANGGTTRTLDLSAPSLQDTFLGLSGDAEVYVVFVDENEDLTDKHILTLKAVGPAGEPVGAAGSAQAVSGSPVAALGPVQSNGTTASALVKKGETVSVTATAQSGYSLDYISYVRNGAVTTTPITDGESFTMPDEALEVTVHFKVGENRRNHTANIILHLEGSTGPVNTAVVGDAGFGTAPTVPTVYSATAAAGSHMDVWGKALDGYYISRIEITPTILGEIGTYTGSFVYQDVDFTMPDADVTVNVYFKAGWPDNADLTAKLTVKDPAGRPGNHAQFTDPAGVGPLTDGMSDTVTVHQGDKVKVKIDTESGYICDVDIKDVSGAQLNASQWRRTADGLEVDMPMNSVTIVLSYRLKGPEDEHEALLYYDTSWPTATEYAEISATIAGSLVTKDGDGDDGCLKPLFQGERVDILIHSVRTPTLTVTNRASGLGNATLTWPLTDNGDGTWSANFIMQDDNADIYVTFPTVDPPTPDHDLVTLVATGPSGVGKTGEAVLTNPNLPVTTPPTPTTATAMADPTGTNYLYARSGDVMTLTATPEPGYMVDSVELFDAHGNVTRLSGSAVSWTGTVTMPDAPNDGPAKVVVTFAEAPAPNSLKAQLVVNNGGDIRNTAELRNYPLPGGTPVYGTLSADKREITGLSLGDGVYIDITSVAPGFTPKITVQPAGSVTSDVTTDRSFAMPGVDVIVYVVFEDNGLPRYDISLAVTTYTTPNPPPPSTVDPANTASLTTPLTATQGPISTGQPAVHAQAQAGNVVTIDLSYDQSRYWVSAATSGATVTGGLTLSADKTQYTFTAPSGNVDVVVTYHETAVDPPPTYDVVLHLLDKDYNPIVPGTWSAAQLTSLQQNNVSWDTLITDVTQPTPVTTISVPFGETVHVSAMGTSIQAYSYVKEAYAMMGSAPAVMLPVFQADTTPVTPGPKDTYNPAGTGKRVSRVFDFTMQMGQVDVYIVLDDINTAPQTPKYTAALTVTGPLTDTSGAAEPMGAAGSATLGSSGGASITVDSNQTFYTPGTPNTITAAENETLTLTVTANPGYKLDTVTITPTGLVLTPTSTATDPGTGKTVYTYTMPASDLDFTVNLIRDPDADFYDVTLHLTDPGADNATRVYYNTYSATADGDTFPVPDGQTVTIDVTAGADSYIKHAYAVTAGGTVLPLTIVTPTGRANLQNYGADDSANPVNGVATFVMPAEDVEVYVVYEKDTNPPTGDLTAVVTMFDPGNTGTSRVTMTRTSPADSVSAVSDGVTSSPLSVNVGEHVTVRVTPAPGYEVDTVVLTGGGQPDVTLTDLGNDRYEFDMPAAPGYDVGVVVTLKQAQADTFTATLVTVDHTSALGNSTSMKVQGTAGVGVVWSGTINNLAGNETIVTTVSPDENVRISAVLATDKSGTRRLSQGSTVNTYNYTMSSANGDVTITVVLDNTTTPHMHVVNVVKGANADLTGNDADNLINTTNPALPGGTLWVGAYKDDTVSLDVTTAPGSYAKVTAVDSAGNPVPVVQQGNTGSVRVWLKTPDDNVTVTVDWSDTPPAAQSYDLTLEMEGDINLQASGTGATLTGGAVSLHVPNNNGGSVMSNTDTTTAEEGTDLTLTPTPVGYFVKKITLISGGVEIDLPVTTTSIVMPSANTVVKVTFEAGVQSARPYDPAQDPNTKGYTPGYLIANNPGYNSLEITVPNLYNTAVETVPDGTVFELYYKNGGDAIRLIPGVDYDVTSGPTAYTHGSFTGQRFTIRSLKGESPLTHVAVNGGLLYITATKPEDTSTTPSTVYKESQLVEVEVPADPFLGNHKAILHIVDSSGVSGNVAEMNVVVGTTGVSTTVNSDWDAITGLLGDERVRTMAKAAPGARVSAVTATVLDSAGLPVGGSVLLDRVPNGFLTDGSQRFPFDMTGEDVLITVYFETDDHDPNDPTRYIASVEKRGAIGVSGNDATVVNDTRSDLLKGQIWAEGLNGNGMKVTVTTAPGYYADVTVVNKSDGTQIAPAIFGVGNGTPFDVLFNMPAADVQVTVTFTTTEPAKAANKLTLVVISPDVEPGNTAEASWTGAGSPLNANGDTPTTDSTAAGEEVPVGTNVTVSALPALITSTDTSATPPVTTVTADYFIKEVKLTWTNGTQSGSQTISMAPPSGSPSGTRDREGTFKMPMGEATVEVIFEKGPRGPRPADPKHSETYTDGAYNRPADHQKGWIAAQTLSADPALPGKLQITVPTLYDESKTNLEDRLSHAGENYKLYWKDNAGYHELVPGTDITISDRKVLTNYATYTYTGTLGPASQTFDAYQFTVEAVHLNSQIDYYIKNGGTIYITAVTAGKPESEYTEVWITQSYKATLIFEPNGDTATMEDAAGNTVNTDGAVLNNLANGSLVTVKDTAADPGYTVVGVVATTVAGSVNVPRTITGTYEYTIDGADVELRVVYKKNDDPLKSKGPYIVTVKKTGDDGLAGNTASVRDVDVTIPPEQQGSIWTAAYEGNVVRIDVSTEPGYYAEITAVRKGTNMAVDVAQFLGYGQLYMPADHVDVTVKYIKGPMPGHTLLLTVEGPQDAVGYETTLYAGLLSGGGIGNMSKRPVAAVGDLVPAGTTLRLRTQILSGRYTVQSAVMVVNGVTIDIPLTDGVSLPLPQMPMADAEVIVTYVEGDQTARPYDPAHASRYTPSYSHNTADDLSSTHQDGWILAVSGGANKLIITVPTLHNRDRNYNSDQLFNADGASYKLYWKDSMGAFRLFAEGSDITITDRQTVTGAFTDGATTYDGCRFTVTIRSPQTLWGGYTLDEYMTNGGSIYITATGSGTHESEKTEVVVPPREGDLIATFYVVDTATDTTTARTHTLDDGLGHTVNADGQQITQLRGGETMTTTVDVSTLRPEAEVQSVTVTTASGGTTFVTGGNVPSATPNAYADRMPNEDADYTVILRDKDSDVYTAAVKVVDPAAASGNTADIVNRDDNRAPNGNIWAVGKYDPDPDDDPATSDGKGETMKVSFTTDTSDPDVHYYVTVTAVLASDGVTPVPLLQLGVTGSGEAYFDMPQDNVQVTVTFSTTPPPDVPLLLTLSGHDREAGNSARVSWTDSAAAPKSLLAVGSAAPNTNDYTVPRAEELNTLVTPGTSLAISTAHASGYVVESVKIKDELSGYELSLSMTMGNTSTLMPVILQSTPKAARITVTYKPGELTPRPYDPEHDPYYSSASPQYAHNTDDDLSTTHQDGWLLAANLGGGSIQVTVPVLAKDVEPTVDYGTTPPTVTPPSEPDQTPLSSVLTEHTFDLYLYTPGVSGTPGTYTRLVKGTDYTMSDPIDLTGSYTYGTDTYVSARFTVAEVAGGKLEGLLSRGGISLYITATNTDTAASPAWFESDRTELVIPSVGLVPYDPERVNDPAKTYEDHWIRAENWGDYLTVTVPTLNKAKDGPVTDCENVDGDAHAFHFYLQLDGTDRTSNMVDVTALVRLTNYDKFFDPAWTAPTTPYAHQEEYKLDTYYTVPASGTDPDRDVTGARFVLEVLTDDEITAAITDPAEQAAALANAPILRKIVDNSGTMKNAASADAEDKRRLYITVVDDTDPTNPQEGEKVDFEVPQYYTFTGLLQSWAPTHTAELSLYRWDASAATPDYESKPFLTLEVGLDPADYDPALYNGHWEQSFTFKSSELAGETFKLKVRKTAHISYDHVGLDMDPDLTNNAQYTESGRNDETAKVFALASPISLFCGDLDPIFPSPDGKIDDLDRNLLAGFLYFEYEWNTDAEGAAGWSQSVLNPDSYAYAADLDGDGLITDLDMVILMHDYNFGRWQEDYGAPTGLDYVPGGLAIPFTEFMAAFALTPEGGELPAEGEVPAEGEEGTGEETPAEGKEGTEEDTPTEGEEGGTAPSEGEEIPSGGDGEPSAGGEEENPTDPDTDPETGGGEEDFSNQPQNPENPDQNPENEGQNDPNPEPDPEDPEPVVPVEPDPDPDTDPDMDPDPEPEPEAGPEDFSNTPQNPGNEDQNPENLGQNEENEG